METDKKNTVLTLEERAICVRVGATDKVPHNQRAQALLALDEGLSQIEASERTGLTPGQVRYWLSKFRQQRTAIFPEELQVQPAPAQPVPVKVPEKGSKSKKTAEITEQAQPLETGGEKPEKSKKVKDKKKKSKGVKAKAAKKKKDSKKKGSKKAKKKQKKDQKKKKTKKEKKGKK